MYRFDEVEDPRRRRLLEALTLAVITAAVPVQARAQNAAGGSPAKLPPGQSIYRVRGDVTVNGQAATLQTAVRPGDTVVTGEASEIIFVVGGHSMILREASNLVIERDAKAPRSLVLTGLRLLTGKLLTVSRNSRTALRTSTATIGIRGTGWYTEAEPDRTYFCTCYGVADIAAAGDPASRATVSARYHDRPLYILREGAAGQRIRTAGFADHSDQELTLIEALVGRVPPFGAPRGGYTAPYPKK